MKNRKMFIKLAGSIIGFVIVIISIANALNDYGISGNISLNPTILANSSSLPPYGSYGGTNTGTNNGTGTGTSTNGSTNEGDKRGMPTQVTKKEPTTVVETYTVTEEGHTREVSGNVQVIGAKGTVTVPAQYTKTTVTTGGGSETYTCCKSGTEKCTSTPCP